MLWHSGRGRLLFTLETAQIGRSFSAELKRQKLADVRAAVVASVAPGADARVRGDLSRALLNNNKNGSVYFFPRDLDGGLRVRPRPAGAVGADRLANALGALSLTKKRPRSTHAIVVDAGTAVTVDVVSYKKIFEGGMIAPGARLGARALFEHTEKLPLVAFERPRSAIGRSTETAIAAGLWHGFRGLVRECVRAALAEFPSSEIFVAGGDGAACMEGSELKYTYCPELTHRGLAFAYLEHRRHER